jgi:mono/diheme cytochrome c family protein
MPDLLAGFPEIQRPGMAAALAGYLSQGKPQAGTDAMPVGDSSRGGKLFHNVGCVACHDPQAGFAPPGDANVATAKMPPGVPLGDLPAKYTTTGLGRFLLDPLADRPGGRMPRVPLTPGEAADIAAFLIPQNAPVSAPTLDPTLASQGGSLFRQLRCASCHASDAKSPSAAVAQAKPLADLATVGGGGCLAEKPSQGLPDFSLDKRQRAAIAAALGAFREPQRSPGIGGVKLALASFNCLACHERDGLGGPDAARGRFFGTVNDEDLGDEGRLPPRLSGVGAKLTDEAIRKMISGEGTVRPYMATRMPDFGAGVGATLTTMMSEADESKRLPPVEANGRNAAGRSLVGTTGMSCITCHNLRGQKSLGVPAVDLAQAPKRLRREWFHAYLLDPAKFRPGTRMPSFWSDGVPAGSKPGTRGDMKKAHNQVDSIWVYLMEIDQTRLPEGMESKGDFELRPTTSPIVFRTFMQGAGMHAIAVGYPQGLHVAFDANQVRWALVWKGRFLDAEGTWDTRAAPVAKPLGEGVMNFPSGPAVARLESQTAAWPSAAGEDALIMRGYRLDAQRVPTFLYACGDALIEDRLLPESAGASLRRSVQVSGGQGTIWVRLAGGKKIESLPDGAWRVDGSMECRLVTPAAREVVLRDVKGGRELIVPLVIGRDQPGKLEALFKW